MTRIQVQTGNALLGMQPVLAFAIAALFGADFAAAADPWRGNWTANTRVVADVNGDKKADLVGFGDKGTWVSLSYGERFTAPSQWHTAYGADASWTADHVRTAADIDGDGKADIIGFGNTATYVSLSNGHGFGPALAVSTAFCSSQACGSWGPQHPRVLADVDGDGKPDIIGFGETATYVALNVSNPGVAGFAAPVSVMTTFCHSSLCGGWTSVFPRSVGDVNGDGKADIVGFGQSETYVVLNTSVRGRASFGPLATIPYYCSAASCGAWGSENPRTLVDVNSDGKADIVGFGEDATYWSMSSSTATTVAFTAPVSMGSSLFCRNCGGWGSDAPRTFADVNGDGRSDLIGFADNGTWVAFRNDSGAGFGAPKLRTGVFGSGALGFLSNWMTDLYDQIEYSRLKDIAIPGSHDAGTYTADRHTLPRNQDADIFGQLSGGIRYLDIRPEHGSAIGDPENYYIHHGTHTTDLKLDTVNSQIGTFLDAHPGEILLLHETDVLLNGDSTANFMSKAVGPIQDRLITLHDVISRFPNYNCPAADPQYQSSACLEMRQIRQIQAANPKKQIILLMSNSMKVGDPVLGDLTWFGANVFIEYSDSGIWETHSAWMAAASKDRILGRIPAATNGWGDNVLWAFFIQLTPGRFPVDLANLFNDDLATLLTKSDDDGGMKNRQLNIVAFDFIEFPNYDIPHAVIAMNLLPTRGCLLMEKLLTSTDEAPFGQPGDLTEVALVNLSGLSTRVVAESGPFDMMHGEVRVVQARTNVPIVAVVRETNACSAIYVPRFGRSSELVLLESVR